MKKVLVVVLFCVFQVVIAFGRKDVHNFRSANEIRKPYQLGERCDASMVRKFTVYVKEQNLDKLEEALLSVSSPNRKCENDVCSFSPTFRKFWTAAQINKLVKPLNSDLDAAYTFLDRHNIRCKPSEHFDSELHCLGTIGDLEAAFSTKIFHIVKVSANGHSMLTEGITHLGSITVPQHVPIDLISGITYIGYEKARRSPLDSLFPTQSAQSFDNFLKFKENRLLSQTETNAKTARIYEAAIMKDGSSCPSNSFECPVAQGSSGVCCSNNGTCCLSAQGPICCMLATRCVNGQCIDPQQYRVPASARENVTPARLRAQYGINSARHSLPATNQSVVAFDDEYSPPALVMFDNLFSEKTPAITRVGPKSCLPNCDSVESDLDVQYMSSIGRGASQTFWYLPLLNAYVLEWASQMLSTQNPPSINSISYISGEYHLGPDYIGKANTELQKLGTMGVSIMACSGDTGSTAWSINFPIDPSWRNTPFSCPDCPRNRTNLCTQYTIFNATMKCNVPSGLYSRDPSLDEPCAALLANADCLDALDTFFSTAGEKCEFSVVPDSQQIPRVFTFGCTCEQLPSITSGSCTIQGFNFSLSNGIVFTPLYPASSPWVTAVGATALSNEEYPACQQSSGVNSIIECPTKEIACSIASNCLITSGGGFSQYSPMPSYQAAAVKAYLNSGIPLPPSNLYNSSNRCYPDVAALGHQYPIVMSNNGTATCPCSVLVVDGTSCSSPAFSGVISLVAQGKKLGFLNPAFYEGLYQFSDIVSGDNKCTEELCSVYGFYATISYDPVTGLGTPLFFTNP